MKYVVERNGYRINCYTIDISYEMKKTAYSFAEEIVTTNNQFSRMIPKSISNFNDQQTIEIQRTYIGKLGELAFLKLLEEKGIKIIVSDMLKVFKGQANTDSHDFYTKRGESIDIKTGFRDNHRRLLVNVQQLNNIPKDYYVAVKIDTKDLDSNKKLVDLESICSANILGYVEYKYLYEKCNRVNFGEGEAAYIEYDKLLGIERLLKKFF